MCFFNILVPYTFILMGDGGVYFMNAGISDFIKICFSVGELCVDYIFKILPMLVLIGRESL